MPREEKAMGRDDVEVVILKAMMAILSLGLACLGIMRAWWV